MSSTARLLASATTLTLCLAVPAAADLTAEQVWESWQQTMADMGQTVDVATVGRTGDALILDGVTITMAAPEAGAVVQVNQIMMAEQADGSVTIEVSPEYRLRMTNLGSAGEDIVAEMTLSHSGLDMTATGDPDAISYAYAVQRLDLVLDNVTADGEPVDMTFSAGIDTISGTYDVTAGQPQRIESSLSAAAAEASLAMKEPDENIDFSMGFTMQDLSTTSAGTLSPFSGAQQNLSALLRSGLNSEGTAGYGPLTYVINTMTPDGQVIVNGSAASGNFDFGLDADGIRYGGGNSVVVMNIEAPGAMVPPMTLEIARSAGELTMPLIASEDAKPIGLKLELDGLVLDDMLWAMIDPMGGLPHDPAKLLIDLSGMGNWFIDISDPEAVETLELEGEAPGELQNVDINAVELSVAGAQLTGSGAFAFNNDTVPPAPSGQVDLQLVGANALIDRLVGIGLIPEDQAMGARMMLGLFARPGDGEDTLVSTIEVKEDGAVIANGQRIR